MPLSLAIALTHLRSRKRQTLVSVLGVAMGVGFFIGIAAMMQGFQRDFVQRIIDAQPHIVMKDEFREPLEQPVKRRYAGGAVELRGLKPKDEIRGIKQGRSVARILSGWPGLEVTPSLHGQVFLRYGSKDVSVNLIGIEPVSERRVTNLEDDLVSGSLEALSTSANGLILGNGVAEKLGAGPNDLVTAVSPTGAIIKMKIVGIFRTGIIALDDTETYALLKKAQVLQNRTNVVNRIRMRLEDATQAQAVARRIEARFDYRTESWQESNEGVLGIFVIQNGIMYSTVGAILIVACFGIFNVISTVIYEKSRDIAILKSMGFAEPDIRAVFLLEGLIVGVAGSMCGWVLGYGLIKLLETVRFDIEGIVEIQHFILWHTPIHYVIASLVSTTAAVLAAWLPARKAAALRPVDIIRGAA